MDIIIEFNEAAFRHHISKEDILNKIFAAMTEEEAVAMSDYFINNKVTLGPNGSDWLSQREMRSLGFSNLTINYLITKAAALHKTPVQIVEEMVREKLAAAV
jgi:hypothetical protein